MKRFFLFFNCNFIFTAGCFLFRAWESILVGVIGAIVTLISVPLLDKLRIDDPVGEITSLQLISIFPPQLFYELCAEKFPTQKILWKKLLNKLK